MRRFSFVLAFVACLILCGLAWAGRSRQASPQAPQTWTGYVTDTHCGTHCQVTSNMAPDLKCIRLCVKRGSKYGIWSGNKVYVLDPQGLASKFAAKNVKVTGTMSAGTIRITSIVPVPVAASSAASKP